MATIEVRQHVQARLVKSREFLDLAVMIEDDDSRDAVVSLCVTAGINAADAVVSLHERSVGASRNHDQAPSVLRQIGFDAMASALARLLKLKPKAQYSIKRCTASDTTAALFNAGKLLELATKECDRRLSL